MQSLQFLVCLPKALFNCGIGFAFAQVFELLANLHVERSLVPLGVVDDSAKLAEANMVQAVLHHIQRGAFVANEEDTLSSPQMISNNVCDCLAFSSARGSVDY